MTQKQQGIEDMDKTATDLHWDDRARSEPDDRKVNMEDTAQRDFELARILPFIRPGDRVLEVGCGNGDATQLLRQHARHVDAFDYSADMVERARRTYGETNNRFLHTSVLAPAGLGAEYDAVVCIRVLINLRDLDQQKLALRNLAGLLRPGGTLLLVEGYRDGFEALGRLRGKLGLGPIVPAAINFYSRLADLEPVIDEFFVPLAEFHSGMYDLLTRIVYPMLVGSAQATGPGEFHGQVKPLAEQFNPDCLEPFARLRGKVLRRR